MTISAAEKERYTRQMAIHEWGEEGQEKLRDSSVFIAGAGGLGCPVATSLALAGVGRLVICDCDTVEHSNLNRQFLHNEADVELEKAQSAAYSLKQLNSSCEVEAVTAYIDGANIATLAAGCDIIVDCLDNLEARMALNGYCVEHTIPLVHGGLWGFDGRLSFLHPPETPCLRCLYQDALPESTIPVAGVTPIIMGGMQAAEVLKYLLNMGQLTRGRMILCSLDTMTFHELPAARDEDCPVCGAMAP
ncbi:MAG: HesA/MoeB/ThiF family protein [Thermodesulfobacteriota bacterium]